MKIAWVAYLGALSRLNAILIPRISAHPPILAQYKVHRPWALFREGTVYYIVYTKYLYDVVTRFVGRWGCISHDVCEECMYKDLEHCLCVGDGGGDDRVLSLRGRNCDPLEI